MVGGRTRGSEGVGEAYSLSVLLKPARRTHASERAIKQAEE